MMGRSHAVSGVATGLVSAPGLGITDPATATVFVLVTAGFALFPDLDHPGSTASRSLGPVTGAVSTGLRHLSSWAYHATRTTHDDRNAGTHRQLSHSVVFALVTGLLIGVLGGVWPWTIAATAIVGIALCSLTLNRRATWIVAAAATSLWLSTVGTNPSEVYTALAGLTWKIGIAVALGMVTHDLGDSITESGCPLLWPLPIRGETWYDLRLPEELRLTTGSRVETRIIVPVLVAIAVAGTWTYVKPLVSQVTAA